MGYGPHYFEPRLRGVEDTWVGTHSPNFHTPADGLWASTDLTGYPFFKSRRFLPPITEIQAESVPEPDEIGKLIEEDVNLARQINFEIHSGDI
ncbi:hypothetical protein TNCV_3861531 [Trichonephila clavipes]|nr:hypothetical protein TNCV_3861531 [Trichonephila clavipes]